ncbi:D-Ala-D-Ala carboxypeptidase family metallohydrolase [Oceanobacter antarcticus]|uniref:D-Ala-D-Ala carboxypeptidase family metallohydrolase n=1 Tax=Oceanobacter antarcticus TaxID=3133425 RepID=A0ABW8NNB5_9GAMM|tara:strand:- start:7546 stop:8130 length:585 start_codon:yes stop_codon:yes gene_type:complete
MQLSKHFSLHEFLVSQTAEREGGEMLARQNAPSDQVVSNLGYLVTSSLEPLRTLLDTPMSINSGYRCELLNSHIGSKSTSQHVVGQAADVALSSQILESSRHTRYRRIIEHKVRDRIGRSIRADASANFYLFATAVMYLHELDIDQLIHEYGDDGQPAWVHISASQSHNRRQILRINRDSTELITLEQALALGC